MKNLFNLESPLAKWLEKVADFMILNFLFVLSCIPIVTIGAAITALYYTVLKMLRQEETPIFQNYLKAFKDNLKEATILFMGVVGMALIAVAWSVVIEQLLSGGVALLVRIILYVFVFRLTMALLYLFPLQATFANPLKTTIKNAYLMSLKHLLTTIAMMAVWGAAVIITIFYPKIVGYGLLWLLFGFSFLAYVQSWLMIHVFRRYSELP